MFCLWFDFLFFASLFCLLFWSVSGWLKCLLGLCSDSRYYLRQLVCGRSFVCLFQLLIAWMCVCVCVCVCVCWCVCVLVCVCVFFVVVVVVEVYFCRYVICCMNQTVRILAPPPFPSLTHTRTHPQTFTHSCTDIHKHTRAFTYAHSRLQKFIQPKKITAKECAAVSRFFILFPFFFFFFFLSLCAFFYFSFRK